MLLAFTAFLTSPAWAGDGTPLDLSPATKVWVYELFTQAGTAIGFAFAATVLTAAGLLIYAVRTFAHVAQTMATVQNNVEKGLKDGVEKGLRESLVAAITSTEVKAAILEGAAITGKEIAAKVSGGSSTHTTERFKVKTTGLSGGYIYERVYFTQDRTKLLQLSMLHRRGLNHRRERDKTKQLSPAVEASRKKLLQECERLNKTYEKDDFDVRLEQAIVFGSARMFPRALSIVDSLKNGAFGPLTPQQQYEVTFRKAVFLKEFFEFNGYVSEDGHYQPLIKEDRRQKLNEAQELVTSCLTNNQQHPFFPAADHRVLCLDGYCVACAAASLTDKDERLARLRKVKSTFQTALEAAMHQTPIKSDAVFTLLNNLAETELQMEDWHSALNHSEGLDAVEPESPYFLDTRGHALFAAAREGLITGNAAEEAVREAHWLFSRALEKTKHDEIAKHTSALETWAAQKHIQL